MNVGDVITLRGKTLKGKNRIREHGDKWIVCEVDRSVISRNLGILIAPAGYLNGEGGSLNVGASLIRVTDGYARWLHPTKDFHFQVVEN